MRARRRASRGFTRYDDEAQRRKYDRKENAAFQAQRREHDRHVDKRRRTNFDRDNSDDDVLEEMRVQAELIDF